MHPSFCYPLIVSYSFLVPKPSNVIMTEMIYAIWNCPGVFPASFANRKMSFIKPTIFQTDVRKLRGQVSLVSPLHLAAGVCHYSYLLIFILQDLRQVGVFESFSSQGSGLEFTINPHYDHSATLAYLIISCSDFLFQNHPT